jgi:hypothetical protein
LAKWVLEQISARIAARREFAKEVTKQISTLAEKHYWALANAAGVLAGQLEGYLADRSVHLIPIWESRENLRARLDEMAEDAGKKSFPYLCRLIWLFDSFQFQGSTTYLLTSHSAGDMCKRLYNVFVGSLPLPQLDIAKIRELTIDQEERVGDKLYKVKRKLRDLPAGALTEQQIHEELQPQEKAFIDWLKHGAVDVSAAASALRAFNELLNHELALLYRVWFRDREPYPEAYMLEQQFGQWPDLLTRQSVDTLALAGYQSNLLRPLGSASTAPSTAAARPPKRADKKKPAEQPQTQGGRRQRQEKSEATR